MFVFLDNLSGNPWRQAAGPKVRPSMVLASNKPLRFLHSWLSGRALSC
jgi:hypothetical protein